MVFSKQLSQSMLIVALVILMTAVKVGADSHSAAPTVPSGQHPTGRIIIEHFPVQLWWQNSDDPDGDLLEYDLVIGIDSLFGDVLIDNPVGVPEGQDSSSFLLDASIDDNSIYWWIVRANDGQNQSAFSPSHGFWLDCVPQEPFNHRADFPNDSLGIPLCEMMPTYTWRKALDPDPFDSVFYRLEIATNADFHDAYVCDSIVATTTFVDFTPDDSLAFGTHYWWRIVACDQDGFEIPSHPQQFWTWLLGDVDHSHSIDIADLVFLVLYMFGGGEPAEPAFVMDLNGDCIAPDIADLIYLVTYMFNDGATPVAGCLVRSGLL